MRPRVGDDWSERHVAYHSSDGPLRHRRHRGRCGRRGRRALRTLARCIGRDHRPRPVRRVVSVLGLHAVEGAPARGIGPSRRRGLSLEAGVRLPRLHDQPRGHRPAGRLGPRRSHSREPARPSFAARPRSTGLGTFASGIGCSRPARSSWRSGRSAGSRTCRASPKRGHGPTSRARRPASFHAPWRSSAAGPTGVELAQVYARYGVPVTLVHPRDRVHDREHRRSSEALGKALEDDGVDAAARDARDRRQGRRRSRWRARHRAGRAATRSMRTRSCWPSAATCLSTGSASRRSASRRRTAALDRDERLRVAENVYVAGDVAGPEIHTHLGHYTGEAAARIALGDDYRPFFEAIPRATYTDPETASVGLLLEQAKERGIDAAEYTVDVGNLVEGLHDRVRRALSSIVVDRERRLPGRSVHGRPRRVGGDPRMRPRHPRRTCRSRHWPIRSTPSRPSPACSGPPSSTRTAT